MSKRVHFVMSEELLQRIDEALPPETSRGEFVRRAVERALEGPVGRTRSVAGDPPDGEPTPAEQPKDPQAQRSRRRGRESTGRKAASPARSAQVTQPPPEPVPEPPAASQDPTDGIPNRPLSRTEAFRQVTQRKRSS